MARRKEKFNYFEAFSNVAKCADKYAEAVVEFLEEHYDEEKELGHVEPGEVLEKLKELHKIEEEADEYVRSVREHMAVEFMTPIEREDILQLMNELDDIVDYIDDILERMYMYNVCTYNKDVVDLIHIMQKAVSAVKPACKRLANYKKIKSIRELVDQITEAEDEADRVYIAGVHRIFTTVKQDDNIPSVIAFGINGLLRAIENCCDCCEKAADTIVTVVMKNN